MSEERRDENAAIRDFVRTMRGIGDEPYAGGVQRLIPDPVPVAQSRLGGSSPSWDLVQLINDASYQVRRQINREPGEFDLDIAYDSPVGMGIRTVRIIVRGTRNRPTYAYNLSIRLFEAIDQDSQVIFDVLMNETRVAIERWRAHENSRLLSRMEGTPVEEWQSIYEEMLERERQEYAMQIMREDSARPEHSGATYDISSGVATADWRQSLQVRVEAPAPIAAPWEDAEPAATTMPRRERLRRRRESRENEEADPSLVQSVLAKLKPIF